MNDNPVKLFWSLDDETLTEKPRVHANLVAQPPVHMFLTTVPRPAGTEVKVRMRP